jgi:hypothetical protein
MDETASLEYPVGSVKLIVVCFHGDYYTTKLTVQLVRGRLCTSSGP